MQIIRPNRNAAFMLIQLKAMRSQVGDAPLSSCMMRLWSARRSWWPGILYLLAAGARSQVQGSRSLQRAFSVERDNISTTSRMLK